MRIRRARERVQGWTENVRYRYPKRRCILRLLPILGLLGNRCLWLQSIAIVCGGEGDEGKRTEVHDVITTDGTIVDNDIPCP